MRLDCDLMYTKHFFFLYFPLGLEGMPNWEVFMYKPEQKFLGAVPGTTCKAAPEITIFVEIKI